MVILMEDGHYNLNASDIAEELEISPSSVHRYRKAGMPHRFNKLRNCYVYNLEDCLDWIKEQCEMEID